VRREYIQATFFFLLLVNLSLFVSAYKVEAPYSTVHQYITSESDDVWLLIPVEIQKHLLKQFNSTDIDGNYDPSNDIITGSGEEDKVLSTIFPAFYRNHYWNPDSPNNGRYDQGLVYQESAYTKARNYWQYFVIEKYLQGDTDEAYYWLGHVAHLIQDLSQPSHVLLDCHIGELENPYISGCADDSTLEEFTALADNFYNDTIYKMNVEHFKGSDYSSEGPYYYENLIDNFEYWDDIEPSTNDYFFRLLWFTAQKTQYFASDEKEQDFSYKEIDLTSHSWDNSGSGDKNLWKNEYISSDDFITMEELQNDDYLDSGPYVAQEADAMIPHAMRATAGLFRLFWDTVHSYSWPTFQHDNRRTGFTILKGDIEKESDIDSDDIAVSSNQLTDSVSRITVADLDGGGEQEVVAVISDLHETNDSMIVGYELKENWFDYNLKYNSWEYTSSDTILLATIGDLTDDSGLEIVFGYSDASKITAREIHGTTTSAAWASDFTLNSKSSPYYGDSRAGFAYFMAIADVNNDGDNEVIAMDAISADDDWNGEVYLIDGSDGTKIGNYSVGNGGGTTISVANLDGDNYEDIVAATYYGLSVLEFDNGATNKLTELWNTNQGKITGGASIVDVDRNNSYDIIFLTTTDGCAAGRTCYKKIYRYDNAGSLVDSETLSYYPLASPAIADVDGDSDYEIVFVASDTPYWTGEGRLLVYDASTLNYECAYTGGGDFNPRSISPTIADINGDGINEIIIPERDSKEVHIIDGTDCSELFSVEFEGIIGSSIAIADLDNDGKAEMAVERSGSPFALITISSMYNDQPRLSPIDNITAVAGNLIDINATGQLNASDPDNDPLTYSFSAPFNSSGLWQSSENDSGEYSILVEVSDGNLTDYQYVDVLLFNSTATKHTNFTDGTIQKYLNFTSAPENKTVTIRIPKESNIVYSRMKIRGGQP